MKIAYLDLVPDKYKLEIICEELKKYAADGTEISYHTVEKGTDNFEHLTFEYFMIPEIMKTVMKLEHEGYDGVIIGCFHDPGLDALRELSNNIVIVGHGESAISMTNFFGKSYSIISPSEKTIPQQFHMLKNINQEHC